MRQKVIVAAGLLLLFLPLAPVAGLRGLLPSMLEFPLRTHSVVQPPFSPAVFSLFAILFVLLLLPLAFPRRFGFTGSGTSSPARQPGRFPVWGYAGLALCIATWVCAWGRFDALAAVNDYTFFPLWLGYILTVDGLVYRRTSSSRISRSPARFALLFPASALAWWYFEYVNRFVQNWWYDGVDHFSAIQYALHATISFSTVFPAIFETADLLGSTERFRQSYAGGPVWREPSRGMLYSALLLGVAALVLTGLYPVVFFYLTWFAPLLILGSALALAGVETPLSAMRRGDYGPLFTLATAALVCGFFWEMWNAYSLPKWHYSVPYVMKAKLFEMPAPGYGGYLPFGPICWCMWLSMRHLARRAG